MLYFLYKFSENEKFKPQVFELLSYVAVLLCLLGIILTKMRSSLFFLLIGMVAVINFKKRFFYKLLLLGCIGTVFLLPIFKESFNVFWSMFNQAAQREVGGSSFAMRVEQFQAIYHIFLDSPIAGLGDEFENFVTQNIFTQKALGYESIWFIQMTRHGLIGVIANLYLAYYTIIKVPRVYGSAKARCLGLAYWLTYTLTSIPSFRISLFYLLYFYCLKCSETYNNVQCGQNKKIIDATCLLPALMRHRIRRKEK